MMTEKVIPVIIDCDPGCDDFFALLRSLLMHKQGKISIKAITTTAGNVSAKATFENAVRACEMLNITDIPIGKGKEKADTADASYIHGNDGIGGLSSLLPAVTSNSSLDSLELFEKTITEHKGKIHCLVFGPMTNLAKVHEKNPGILNNIKKVIAMGGAFFVPGNVTPVAEFNIWFDPESAKIVTDNYDNLTFVPLDTTTQTIFNIDDLLPVLDHIKNETHRKFLTELTKFTIGTNMGFRETHYRKGFFVHDASTICFLLYPHLYKGTFYKVNVETKGEFTRGMTVVDIRNHPKTEFNAFIVSLIDVPGFLEAMTEDFKHFEG